jgi:hypothetical protein
MPEPASRQQEELQEFLRTNAGPPGAGDLNALTDSGEDPKGWDRASVALNTHPLHRFPRVSQKDFILPPAGDRLRLLGDAAVFGACMALLCFFPLWVANVLTVGGLDGWIWQVMLFTGVGSALFLFVQATRAEHAFQREIDSLL